MNSSFLRFFILCFFAVIALETSAQSSYYRSPVDIPISLSGNVGEFRSDHFHTGLDIRGGGVVGASVFAVADGYVSRISVSPTGYGNALYINHSNGTMSVYAHLDRFDAKIAKWVEKQQYARKSFAVDLYPAADLFAVKRGDRIAYLGNSGSSGGPHLHFEIRNPKTQNPMNIGQMGLFKIVDNVAPVVRKIWLYEQDAVLGAVFFRRAGAISIAKNKAGLWELSDSVFYVDRPCYLAYEVSDYKNGANFTMAIYSLEQRVDGVRNFGFKIDEISFATTRYVNTMAQYDLTRASRYDVIRAYVAPNNLLGHYIDKRQNGIIAPPVAQGERKAISTVIFDDNGNSVNVEFYLEKRKKEREVFIPDKNVSYVAWDRDFSFRDSVMQVAIPAKSLYETSLLSFSTDGKSYRVGSADIPLQRAIVLKINKIIEPNLCCSALFVNEKGKSAGGEWVDGQMVLKTRNFGVYKIDYDTIKPTVSLLKIGTSNLLRFKITDNLSGIASYQLMIDAAWALAAYDPKTASLRHRFARGEEVQKDHKIELKVVDGKGNTQIYRTTQKW